MESLLPSSNEIKQFDSDAATKEFLSTFSSFLLGQEDCETRLSADELELTKDDLEWLATCFPNLDELRRLELQPSVGSLFERMNPIDCNRSPLEEALYPYSVKPAAKFS
ncbi:hypothetical protein AMTR_s01692p00003290 [Amborella trichopoda]|uniref:Uncharacterized protein n=1 Tax=Amborella trichopoda TaxID=13333 RepID=W1PH54_AMBTC|nr:hypothetical protein AMTR_s01692p00003290 [Amborella trichopoda]